MSAKDKRQHLIKEVLQSAGALDSAAIKERVCARLSIELEHYPKATFLRHLKELVDNREILLEESYGKNIYSLPDDGWDVIGQKYIESLGHRIFVPKIIRTAGVRIVPGFLRASIAGQVTLVLELGQLFFTLQIHRDALPFHMHISRTQPEYKKPQLVTQYGGRTVFLEVMVRKVSGYKPEDPRRHGHAILSFDATGKVSLEDLGSTHGTFHLSLTPADLAFLEERANDLGQSTSRQDGEREKIQAQKVYLPIEEFVVKEIVAPVALRCSDEFALSLIS